MKPHSSHLFGRSLLFLAALPWTLTVGWGWVLLARVLGIATDLRWEGLGVLTAVWRPWVTKLWTFSTTLGRGIIYVPTRRAQPGWPWTRIQHHEHVHVRQVEDLMLLSLCVGTCVALASGSWLAGLAIWWSGGAWQLPNFVAALLRGGSPYRDAEHERSAYAQTDDLAGGGMWLDRRGGG